MTTLLSLAQLRNAVRERPAAAAQFLRELSAAERTALVERWARESREPWQAVAAELRRAMEEAPR